MCLFPQTLECDELFKLVTWNSYSAGETIMTTGESIEAGLFMLVDGKLSVYSDEEGGNEIFKYSLTSGESVGDLDLVCDPSTKSRGMTVRVEQDSLVMQLKQASWKHFCSSNPHALLLYLRLAIGRLHRVATFVLADFIPLPDFKTILPDVTRGPDKSILEANIAQLGIVAVEFQAGSNIISVGNAPEDIVIIFSGEINPPVTPLSFKSPPLHSLLHPPSLFPLSSLLPHTHTLSLPGSKSRLSAYCLRCVRHGLSTHNQATCIVAVLSQAPGGGCCILGARAFFSTQLHSQDVCAVTSCRGARLSLNSLLDLGQTDPDAFISLISAAANILVPVIAKFITLGLSRHWIKAGEDVFIEGGDADGVYVVITGRVKLRLEETGEVLAEVGRGDTIGEEAVLDQVSKDATSIKRIFSARCMRDCELVKISPSNFEHICFNYPQVRHPTAHRGLATLTSDECSRSCSRCARRRSLHYSLGDAVEDPGRRVLTCFAILRR
jgi:CRP-like cAMP-binding protein